MNKPIYVAEINSELISISLQHHITLRLIFSPDAVLWGFSSQKVKDGQSWGTGRGTIALLFLILFVTVDHGTLLYSIYIAHKRTNYIPFRYFKILAIAQVSVVWQITAVPLRVMHANFIPNYQGTGGEVIYTIYVEVCKDTWEMTKIWSCHVFWAGYWCFEVVCWALACWSHLHRFSIKLPKNAQFSHECHSLC